MENKEEKLVQTNEAFEEYKKAVSKLKDSPFKDFYQNNPKEMKYLFSKVDIDDLEDFAKRTFSLADIWQCLYIESYKRKYNIETKEFKAWVVQEMPKVEKGKRVKSEKINEQYVLKSSIIGGIESKVCPEKNKFENKYGEFPCYDSFKRTKDDELNKVLSYVFCETNMKEKFKEDTRYKFTSLEAMFLFFVFDDIYKENIQYIKSGMGQELNRRFMNDLYRYAKAISKERNFPTNNLKEIHKKRKKELKSDLPRIGTLVQEALVEFKKGEEADLTIVMNKSKQCIDKLNRFVQRVEKLQKDTTDISN